MDFFRDLRLSKPTFQYLLNIIEDNYAKESGKAIEAKFALMLSLWYLANKCSFRELAEIFGLSKGSAHNVVIHIIN